MCICKQSHGARVYKHIRLWQGAGSLPRCVLPRGYAGHACAGIISSRGPALARRNAGWMDLFQNKLGKNVRRGDSTLDTRSPASQHNTSTPHVQVSQLWTVLRTNLPPARVNVVIEGNYPKISLSSSHHSIPNLNIFPKIGF